MNTYYDVKIKRNLQVFGFFKGVYEQMDALGYAKDFAYYQGKENILPGELVLAYLKRLLRIGNMRMQTALLRDIFTGLPVMISISENYAVVSKGWIIDGKFCFPIDFVYYYEHYNIGIPKEYELHVLDTLGFAAMEEANLRKHLAILLESPANLEALLTEKIKRDEALHDDHHH